MKYWFSEACVHEWKIRNQQAYARHQVFLRDKGVCQYCGRDTEKERQDHWLAVRKIVGCHKSYDVVVRRVFYDPPHPDHKNRWQADHIVPVVEGGGQCGLDGLRTLCTDCHVQETRKLARRLAERRRELKTVLDQPILPL